MNTKIILLIFMSLMTISCVSHQYRDYYYYDHRNENNQCFFVVDTIDIPEPIVVKEKGDYFIVSQSALENGAKNIENLYHETDVYIANFDEFFFYKYLDKKFWPRYMHKALFYSDTEKIIINGKTYDKFKSPNVSFVLGLIKVNYYNTVMANSCDDWYMIKNKEYKNSYYRIVFPILDEKGSRCRF